MKLGPVPTYDQRGKFWRANGVRLTAVTSAVKKYVPEFDEVYWSRKKSEERGVEPEVIIAEWRAKGAESRSLGNKVHAAIKDAFERGGDIITPSVADKRIPQIGQALDAIKILGMKPAGVEKRITSAALGLTGVVDFIGWVNGERAVVDWKTGKVDTSCRFRKLLPPLDRLEDCKLNQYALQLGLYAEILKVENGNDDLKRFVIELHEDDWQMHEAPDVSMEINAILAEL